MMENATTAKPGTTISPMAARLSFGGAAVFVVLLAALHFIKPGLDPSWRVISEYEIGRYGWVMRLAFLSLAFSCASLSLAIRPHVRTIGGRVGLIFLLVAAAGMVVAALFAPDPMTAKGDELTTHGNLHALGAALGIGFPIAAALIGRSLARNRAWAQARRALLWSTALVWLGFLAFASSMVVMFPADGEFGPDVLIGWPNRFMIVAYSLWLMVIAQQAIRTGGRQPSTERG